MVERACRVCKELLQKAQSAAVRHVDALSRLRLANIRSEHESIAALEAAVEETRRERERTMALLRDHFATHSEGKSAEPRGASSP